MNEQTKTTRLTKEQKPWRESINVLKAFAEKLGLTVELRNPSCPEYQLARLTCDGVRLIAYPHKTTAGNHHVRIRNEHSKNVAKATEIMKALWWRNNWVEKKGFCGFEIKNFPEMTISEAIYGK